MSVRRRWAAAGALGVAGALAAGLWLHHGEEEEEDDGRNLLAVHLPPAVPELPEVSLLEGAKLPPGARVRLRVESARDAVGYVLGLSADGKATLYAPEAEAAPRLKRRKALSLGEVTLSPAAGPDRLWALFCPKDPGAPKVLEAATRALHTAGSPRSVTTLGLPCAEASVLLELVSTAR